VLFGAIAKACGDAASRARALTLATAVGSMGQVLVVPLAQALLAELGWRSALWCLAAVAALALPMALGLKVPTAGGPQATAAQVGVPLARAWRDRAYVLVALGFTACGVQLVFIATHLPAYLIGCGLSAGDGALSLALVGLFNVAGTYVLGRLAVRIAPTVLLAGVYGLRTLAIVAFISLPPTPLSAAVFASAMGLLWLGVGPVMTHLLATLYGLRHLSALFGGMYFTHQVGSFLGAWAGGALFESTGGYTVAWWLCVAVGAAAVVLTLAAGRGPTHGAPSITPQAA
jgi:predicted MFS family arabinose efflux permease